MELATQSNIKIIDSNIQKEEMQVYKPNTLYSLGVEVQHKEDIYECLKDNVKDVEPSKHTVLWQYKRKANYYNCFDFLEEGETKNNEEIFYSFDTKDVNCVALFGIEAMQIQYILKNQKGEIIFNVLKDTATREVQDWYDWTFEEAEIVNFSYVNSLPMLYNGILEIRIKNPNATAKCKYLFFGRSKNYGLTLEKNPRIEIYASNKKDINNKTKIFKNISIDVLILGEKQRNLIFNRLEKLVDKPILALGEENKSSPLTILGTFKSLNMPIASFCTEYTLEIKGVIAK